MIITTKISLAFLQAIFPIIVAVIGVDASSGNNEIKCLHRERQALLEFKAGLIDNNGELSSWENGKECCHWAGVLCDDQTNRIVALDLSRSRFKALKGKIVSPSLLELKDLRHLDLNFINFNYSSRIPEFIGSLVKLQYLNLSHCNFESMIPDSFRNLSMLRFLDLHESYDHESNLDWLSGLQSLEYLDLSSINLTKANNKWVQAMNELPMAREIHLQNCGLSSALPTSSIHFVNASNSLAILDLSDNYLNVASIFPWLLNHSSSLRYLDLSFNHFEVGILNDLKNFGSLSHLDLSWNNFLEGRIPIANLWNLTRLSSSLKFLDLSRNKLKGKVTDWMIPLLRNYTLLEHLDLGVNLLYGSLPDILRFSHLKHLAVNDNQLNGSIENHNYTLPNLQFLDVSRNMLTGRIPNFSSLRSSLKELNLNGNMFSGTLAESIGNLSYLKHLDLASNYLEGLISESHYLFNLANLQWLDLSFNLNLTIQINPLRHPHFQFVTLLLAYCNLGPNFPGWLQNQRQIVHLDISNAKIWDTLPNWFWNNFKMVEYLNMSHNQIHGSLPDLSSYQELLVLDLRFNQFNGTLTPLPPTAVYIDLSKNKFVGSITCFGNLSMRMLYLGLGDNKLSGKIPSEIFMNLTSKVFQLNLENNNFSGNIPMFNHSVCVLDSLYLRNNTFTGYIPKFLEICGALGVLDLGENKFYGTIPSWLGESMPNLVGLQLNSNQLHGSLPSSLCRLSRIQILDISMNNISGVIPNCVNNFTMLKSKSDFTRRALSWQWVWLRNLAVKFQDNAHITWKGKVVEYIKTVDLLKVIDLSNNNLVGEIPHEITNLVGLLGLNLSNNNLVGSIPHNIGQLELLNFLDLSQNKLIGKIPSTISKMNRLGILNLSFNNLSGKIPWDAHMDTFEASSYVGNLELCGRPLKSKPCPGDKEMSQKPKVFKAEEDKMDSMWKTREFYISMIVGFIISFWGVLGNLYISKWWNLKIDKMLIAWKIGCA